MLKTIITQTPQSTQENRTLNPKHLKELTQKRGLDLRWVEANCQSVDAKTASEYLGYTAKSDGILLSGHGFQKQFKPDKPWGEEGKRKPKYRSCKDYDGYDVMLPRHPDDENFWDDLEALKAKCYQIDGHPCIVLTEGFFKGISLTSHGVPTISLLGVEMGLTSGDKDPQKRRYLVPTLEKLARAGFGFIIGFDADCATKTAVNEAQRKLAYQLSLFKVPVYSITGLWTEAEGKGIDDYILMSGADKFKSDVLARAEAIKKWEQQFKTEDNKPSNNRPVPRLVAKEIAEDFQQRFKYHNQQQLWRYWNDKYWEKYDDGSFLSAVKTILDSKNVNYKGHAFLEAMKGDERGIKKLLAVINGVIKFRFSELQQFVHLSGKPGTGKGTFLRLLQKCVGKGNYQGSSLSALTSEYELASIIDKPLVIFSDERKQVGCETILKLTGGDDIRFREIRKSPGSAPFLGTTVIASNHTVFAGDTTGLDRRLCLIPFNNPVPIQKRTGELENLMDGEIPQLIAVALQLSDSEVTQLIRGYGDADIAEFKLHEWRMKMESNSVAAFFNDALILDLTSEARVSFLFDAYKAFCDQAGLKPLSQVKFLTG